MSLVADIFSILTFLGVIGFIVLYMQSQKTPAVDPNITAIEGRLANIESFTSKLDASPQYRGTMGEEIVRTLLAELPDGSVHEQYSGSDIPGRPDFVITIPGITDKMVIDAKFIVEDTKDMPIAKNVMNRAKGIMKYIVPGVTFDFVIMWVPEHAYAALHGNAITKLYQSKVIPATNSNLMALVYLVLRAHKVFKLNEAASEFHTYKDKVENVVNTMGNTLNKGITQLENGLKNTNIVKSKLADFERLTD